MHQRWPRIAALAVVVVLIVALAWRGRSDREIEPSPDAALAAQPSVVAAPAPSRGASRAPPAPMLDRKPSEPSSDKPRHTIDPCDPVTAPELPSDFPTLAINGITIAWDPSVAIEPTTLAYLTAGLVAQAAIVTGTIARPELAVVVYPSLDALHAKTRAPAWSAGVYDGAVRVPAVASDDFGVSVQTLRHEVMHAQLHAAIGCAPVWLDEGLAQYFGNETPDHQWLMMLVAGSAPSIASLQVSAVEEVRGASTAQIYAQCLALLLYALDRTDLQELLRDLRRATASRGARAALELWDRRFSDARDQDVLSALARRIFGVPLGPELDQIFAGAVCCTGAVGSFACTAAPRRAGRHVWFDDDRMCRVVP